MSSILDDLPEIIGGALGDAVFYDATLTRDVQAAPDEDEPWVPGAPTQQSFQCKAIVEQYGVGHLRESLVAAGDVKLLVLASTLATTPQPLDRIAMTAGPAAGLTFTVVPSGTPGWDAVRTDPSQSVWELRARK